VGILGCHDSPGSVAEEFGATQEFVIAGRRLPGARHELIPFGRLHVELFIGDVNNVPKSRTQTIDTSSAEVRTSRVFENAAESTRSMVLAHKNAFLIERRIANVSNEDIVVAVRHLYQFGARDEKRHEALRSSLACCGDLARFEWECGDLLGVVNLSCDNGSWEGDGDEVRTFAEGIVAPGDEMVVRIAITFSDRIEFCLPVDAKGWDADIQKHQRWWDGFWSVSEIETGDSEVDRFREIALYTIACQATPWSVPPTVSERYWGGGAFHDEWYPFIALLSGGWDEMAARIPYFRLATLDEAKRRANFRGALYPWSSTEDGKERDPHGHWYSERFHLGLIAGCASFLWIYQWDFETLRELYPILRECARYFELNMIERDERGAPRTIGCTDFDESTVEVAGGPFTMGAAYHALERASEAARRLDVDGEMRVGWDRLARQLRQQFAVDSASKRYVVPGGHPQHYSCVGFAVPFFADCESETIRNTVSFFGARLKTANGWAPGLAQSFEGTTWLWTAGHLAMCDLVLGNASDAWEKVRKGPDCASQFMSPNEHLDRDGQVRVPWFTTGCGAWVGALHWMFARADQTGDYVLMGIPEELKTVSFRGLRLSRGVTVSGRVVDGVLTNLSFNAPKATGFTFEIPSRFVEKVWTEESAKIYDLIGIWRIQVELSPGENQFV